MFITAGHILAAKNASTKAKFCFTNQKRNLKFIQFTYPCSNQIRVGLVKENDVYDLNDMSSVMPYSLVDVIKYVPMEFINRLQSQQPPTITLNDVCLKAPLHNIDKVICIASNYHCFCDMHKTKVPKTPTIFGKFPSTIIGPCDEIKVRLDVVKHLDYETELCVVMGHKASRVLESHAYKYVFGYTVAQDITSRDWQKSNNGQWLLGKSMDTFCPIGPCIVTADEIKDVNNLEIRCSVNGYIKQNSNTKQMIFKIPNLIERITSVMTLLPGDIILTGTPAGVGMYAKPPQFLKCSDVLFSEIPTIGCMRNVIAPLF